MSNQEWDDPRPESEDAPVGRTFTGIVLGAMILWFALWGGNPRIALGFATLLTALAMGAALAEALGSETR